MDNVTHALAGLLLADATVGLITRKTGAPPSTALTRTAVVIGVVAAELPDADLLYSGPLLGMGKLGYLLHHRGHTHTIVGVLLLAVLLWGVVLLLQRAARAPEVRGAFLGLSVVAASSHLLLDFTNSYGVHPFWPLQSAWYYGDAMFIIEPWIWVVAIPALLFGARSRWGRVLLALALGGILLVAAMIDMVGSSAATALVVGAVLALLAMWRATPARRVLFGVVGWCLVESVGLVSARASREVVAQQALTGLQDVVLTPSPANPLCFSAMIVEADSSTYRVSTATVAPWASVRSAAACVGGVQASRARRANSNGLGGGLVASTRADAVGLVWEQEWTAPVQELADASADNCAVAAALRFIRVPVWEARADRTIALSDLRYGNGGDGFADVVLPDAESACPRFVPSWVPPRVELLR